MVDFFGDLKRKAIQRILDKLVGKQSSRVFLAVGDATEFVSNRGLVYGSDASAILINGYRQCSFSGYALTPRGRRLSPDRVCFEKFHELVLSLLGPDRKGLAEPDANSDYGILILHEDSASKTAGFRKLMEHVGPGVQCVMVGDGRSDIIDLDQNVVCCAVGNADPILKDFAKRTRGVVAEATFTQGVIEILTSLRL